MATLPRKPWAWLPALWLVAHCAVANTDCVQFDSACNPTAGLLLYSFRASAAAPHNNAGMLQWTRLHGIAGVQTDGRAVATDPAGNIFLAGFTDGNLGGQTLTGIRDLFLVKYEASGARLWTRLLGAAGADSWGFGIQVDPAGNIFITGGTAGNLDGQIRTGNPYDVHMVKYDSAGVKQWTRLLGVAAVSTEGNALALDAAGNAYTVGYTDGNLDGQIRTGARDLFLIKYDTNGVKQWTSLFGVAGVNTRASAIAADTAGNLYVAGATAGSLGGQTLTGTQDMFLVKYDTNGTRQWTRLLGDAGVLTDARAVAVQLKIRSFQVGEN